MERANGLILFGIKPRLVEPLERSAGCWLDELPAVLWSVRTTPNKSTGFTPFFLVYGAEAVIPTDIEFDSPRVTMYTLGRPLHHQQSAGQRLLLPDRRSEA